MGPLRWNRRPISVTLVADEFDERRARHERLRYVHSQAIGMIQFEAKLVLDRTTAYMLATSFLLAAYGTSYPDNTVLLASIAVVGLLLSAVHPFLIARTILALEYWRATAALVESDHDFWFPGKLDATWSPSGLGVDIGRSDVDLDLIVARQRRISGYVPRQHDLGMRMGRPPAIVMRLQGKVPEPNRIFSTWLPVMFGAIWTIAFVTGIAAPNSPSEPVDAPFEMPSSPPRTPSVPAEPSEEPKRSGMQ